MAVRILLLGRVRVFSESRELTDTLSRGQLRLLAYLATRESEVTRRRACRDLWPDELDFTVTGNRLRVSLSRFRAELPLLLVETRDTVQINWEAIETDVSETLLLIRQSQDFVDPEQELDFAWRTIDALSTPALPELEDEWATLCAQAWSKQTASAALRLAQIAAGLADHSRAQTAARAAVTQNPGNSEAWRLFLEASAHLGQGAEGIRFWKELRSSSPFISRELTDQIAPLVKSIQSGEFPNPESPGGLDAAERTLAGEMFERILAHRPALAREILASPEVLPIAAKDPRRMSELLDRVIETDDARDEIWARCAARAIGCRAWINDFRRVLELAPKVLDATDNPMIRRAVFNAVSVAKSLRRDWKGAIQAIDEAISIASKLSDPIERLSGEGNKASFLWLQGQYDEAIAIYDSCLAQLREIPGDRSLTEMTVCMGNRAFVPVMRGDFATGLDWMEEAHAFRMSNGLQVQGDLTTPALAMLRMIHGQRESAVDFLRDGLVVLYQSGSARSQQIGLEYAAGALVALGDRKSGEALIDWVHQWRIRTGLFRAPAEEHLMQSILALPVEAAQTISTFALNEEDSPRDVAHRLMRQLRILCRSA